MRPETGSSSASSCGSSNGPERGRLLREGERVHNADGSKRGRRPTAGPQTGLKRALIRVAHNARPTRGPKTRLPRPRVMRETA